MKPSTRQSRNAGLVVAAASALTFGLVQTVTAAPVPALVPTPVPTPGPSISSTTTSAGSVPSAQATAVATAITDLSRATAQAGGTTNVTVSGRLVEAETLLFPLGRMPVAVRISDGVSDRTVRTCTASTDGAGRFSCSVDVLAEREGDVVTVSFEGNKLFKPTETTHSFGGLPAPAPVPTPPPAAPAPEIPTGAATPTPTGTPSPSVSVSEPTPTPTPTATPTPPDPATP